MTTYLRGARPLGRVGARGKPTPFGLVFRFKVCLGMFVDCSCMGTGGKHAVVVIMPVCCVHMKRMEEEGVPSMGAG